MYCKNACMITNRLHFNYHHLVINLKKHYFLVYNSMYLLTRNKDSFIHSFNEFLIKFIDDIKTMSSCFSFNMGFCLNLVSKWHSATLTAFNPFVTSKVCCNLLFQKYSYGDFLRGLWNAPFVASHTACLWGRCVKSLS